MCSDWSTKSALERLALKKHAQRNSQHDKRAYLLDPQGVLFFRYFENFWVDLRPILRFSGILEVTGETWVSN